MKQTISLLLIAVILISFIPALYVSAEKEDFYKFFEAEDGIVNSEYTITVDDKNASGNKYIAFKKHSVDMSEITPVLSYAFTAPVDDFYCIYIRVKVPDVSHDSFYYALNNTSYQNTYALPVNGNEWYWHRVEYKNLSAGEYTFDLFPREPTSVDKIFVTNMRFFIPGGTNESPEDDVVPFITHEGPQFKPKAGHPRVLFDSSDINRIKENMNAEENEKNKTKFYSYLKSTEDGSLKAGEHYNAALLETIESRAFDYAINGNEVSGKSAISSMKNYVDTVIIDSSRYWGMYSYMGQIIYTMAKVYDWCYPLLAKDDYEHFHKMFISVAMATEVSWPPTKLNGYGGHGGETQLLRDMLAAGIAMYDEYPYIYNNVAGRVFDEYIEFRKDFMYNAHVHTEGEHYFRVRYGSEIMATLLMDAIDYPYIFGQEQQYAPYWLIYARRPDGAILRNGDSMLDISRPGSFYSSNYYPIFQAANYYNDPYLKMEAKRESKNFSPEAAYANQSLSPVEFLIFNKPEFQEKPLEELPLAKYFPAPYGGIIARTSWEEGIDSPAVLAEMKVSEFWFPSHSHLDSGSFQIYYKGPLAMDTGLYATASGDGNTYYGSDHYNNYHSRTVAHNCMLIADPNEKCYYVPDGGQRLTGINSPDTYDTVKANYETEYRTGKVLAHDVGDDTASPDYTYLKGDLSYAYTDKVTGYERSFMFLNLKNEETPAALIVFDRVESSDPTFKKTWLLHGKYEPEINGNRTVFINNQDGFNGKMTVDTLFPETENSEIVKIGGEGYDFYVRDVTGKTEGTNWTGNTYSGGVNESANGWRMELSPKTATKEDYFLNVIQVSDADGTNEPLSVEKIDAGTHYGASVSDRVVLFGKKKERISEEINFNITGNTDKKIIVTDLTDGVWEISKNGIFQGIETVTEEAGTIYFDGNSGNYTLRMISDKENTPKVLSSPSYNGQIDYLSLFMNISREDYLKAGNYAILAAAKNYNPGSDYELVDFGFVFSPVEFEPSVESSSAVKVSLCSRLNNGANKFGTLFYGTGIEQDVNYFIRPYAKYEKNGSQTVVYGETIKHKATPLTLIP